MPMNNKITTIKNIKPSIYILSTTKNIYSFIKHLNILYLNRLKYIKFTKNTFFEALKSFIYTLFFYSKYSIFYSFNSKKRFKRLNTSKFLYSNFKKKVDVYLMNKFQEYKIDNKFYYLKYFIFMTFKLKKMLLLFNKKKNFSIKKNYSFFKNKKNIFKKATATFFYSKINYNFFNSFSTINKLFFRTYTFLLIKYNKKLYSFVRIKKRIPLKNYNFLKYILFFNSLLKQKQLLKQKKFFFKHFLDTVYIRKKELVLLKPLKKVYSSKNVFFETQLPFRNVLKTVYLYYFFILFKKTFKEHIFSIIYNVFFNLKKERVILKKKLTFFFNVNTIGTITYKNTLRNVFFTLSDYTKNPLYNISSGILKFYGRKKTYRKTLTNLTRRFFYKIQNILKKKNICFLKLRITGFYQETFTFLRIFYKRIYIYKKNIEYIKKYISFFRKYILFIKRVITYKKENILFSINQYISLISYLFYMIKYYYLKNKKTTYLNIKLLNIQIKTPKFFSK